MPPAEKGGKMKKYENLQISDPFMFGKVTLDPVNCQGILESLLGERIEIVAMPQREKFIQARKGGKFVKLDLFVEDDKRRVFNAEMLQNESANLNKQRELPLRSRYYQSMIDAELVESGQSYLDISESFIIFICTFDPFGMGKYRYTFTSQCAETPNLKLGDLCTKIFFNTTADLADAPKETRALLEYIRSGMVSNDITRRLEHSVQRARENEEWGHEYMLSFVWEMDVRNEGKTEGRELQLIEQVMKKVKRQKSLAQIAEDLEETEESLRPIYDAVMAAGAEDDAETIYNRL